MSDELDELEEMLNQLALQRNSGRTDLDRYRDFRELFRGSELGKRVLHDILYWGHLHQSTAVIGDSHEAYKRDGERKMALKIWFRSISEPSVKPQKQQTKPEGN